MSVCLVDVQCVFVFEAGVCGGRQIGPEALQVLEVRKEKEGVRVRQTGRKTDGRLFTLQSDSNRRYERQTFPHDPTAVMVS